MNEFAPVRDISNLHTILTTQPCYAKGMYQGNVTKDDNNNIIIIINNNNSNNNIK